MKKPKWIAYLENRWQVNTWRVILILIVFACTGFTVMFLKRPIMNLLYADGEKHWVFTVLYYVFILPLYNIVLLIYGFLFGQFSFFWAFEKRMFKRMTGQKNKTENNKKGQDNS